MQIFFESWIKEQNISEDSVLLFEEAIKCYKVGAYRASFLMSYLGFMKALRDRLLRSEKPNLIHEETWKKTKNDLKDDKVWEEIVYKSIQEKEGKQSKVYLINNDLIEEMPYWRKKRNECAHAKDTIIGYSHVETFWLFLQANLAKFIVNGGKTALLDRIEKHFDKSYTEAGADFSYLIKEIPLVVKSSEIPNLLKEINDDYVKMSIYYDQHQNLFWKEIAYSPNTELNESFIEYITSDSEVFLDFIEAFPDRLTLCIHNREMIRFFWREQLFDKLGPFSESFWEISLILLRNSLIPESELHKFMYRLSVSLNKGHLPSGEQTILLRRYGIFELIRETVFISGILNKSNVGYQNANNNAEKIIYYLSNCSLDIEVVRELNILFSTYSFGALYHNMEKFISEKPGFKYKFSEIADTHNLVLAEFFRNG